MGCDWYNLSIIKREYFMKVNIKNILNKYGYDVVRVPKFSGSYSPYSSIDLQSTKVVDLESLAQISSSIPGMIGPRSGQILYTMCYVQDLKGDVVEIGSWQGRSTSFLARAVHHSKNGLFYAVDHFKGNVGKESFYRVGKNDLSDLENGFWSNMRRVGLSDSVQLLNMANEEAEKELRNIKIRFLFIDGDHTKEGVEKDIELFFPKLMERSIVVFDDFSEGFPGLIEAVDTLLSERRFSRVLSYHNTLVLML